MVGACLIILGILSRVFIHIPNFTPLIAIALFSGINIKKQYALILPLLILAVSDLLIGFHNTMIFTWGSVLLISAIGLLFRGKQNFKNVFATSLLCSVLFFVITNLGVWIVGGLYPMTLAGLYDCFIMAIPFFRNEVLSTLLYTAVIFGAFEAIKSRVQATRFAHVL